MQERSKLATIRRKRRLSGLEVAQMVDISPTRYYLMERGERPIPPVVARRLSKALGVKLEAIMKVKAYETKWFRDEKEENEDEDDTGRSSAGSSVAEV